jgi:hypothetical protein
MSESLANTVKTLQSVEAIGALKFYTVGLTSNDTRSEKFCCRVWDTMLCDGLATTTAQKRDLMEKLAAELNQAIQPVKHRWMTRLLEDAKQQLGGLNRLEDCD